jgi:cell division protein FtsB
VATRTARGGDAKPAAEPAAVKHKTAFTSRAAVLAVVVAALAIALAAPVRQLLSQRAQIASLRTSVETQKQQVADLEKAKQLWADPSYVAAQAEDRLHYVRPGQVPFVTLSPTPSAPASALAAAALADQPWYGRLWSSVKGAAAVPARTPSQTSSPQPTLSPELAPAPQVTPSLQVTPVAPAGP